MCLTLLIANILRVLFWFGHRFELPLLIQSFVIIIGMLAMMEICVRVKKGNSAYMISPIGPRSGGAASAAASRRSGFFGKLLKRCFTSSSYDNEVTPIYSVSSQQSTRAVSEVLNSPSNEQLASASNGHSQTTASLLSSNNYDSVPHSLPSDPLVSPTTSYYSSGFTSRKPQRVQTLWRRIDKCEQLTPTAHFSVVV